MKQRCRAEPRATSPGGTPSGSTGSLRSGFRPTSRSCLAWLLAALAVLPPTPPALAHGGEDHSHEPPAAAPSTTGPVGEAPRRLADGNLFLPKSAQHRLGLRTVRVASADLAQGREFPGRVIADPAASGRVQASQAGRLTAVASGWPTLGQRVARGQALARLRPTLSGLEQGGQQAQLAELDAQIALTRARLARYAQLEGAIPGKEVEAARIDLAGLEQRRAAIAGGLAAGETLTAPVAGVISAAHAVPGQVVEARETLFEIVDPDRLAVEALAYDPAEAVGLAGASLELPGGGLPLAFVGAGRQLRDQALPLLFRLGAPAPGLAVGQPVKVVARTRATVRGMPLPRAALERNPGGGERLWLKLGPERFVLRPVQTRPLDAERVAVVAGLAEGDRVVVTGAGLLAQVR